MTNAVEKQDKEKAVKFEEGKLVIEKEFTFDPNNDGEPLGGVAVRAYVNLEELPDEAVDAWLKMKGKK